MSYPDIPYCGSTTSPWGVDFRSHPCWEKFLTLTKRIIEMIPDNDLSPVFLPFRLENIRSGSFLTCISRPNILYSLKTPQTLTLVFVWYTVTKFLNGSHYFSELRYTKPPVSLLISFRKFLTCGSSVDIRVPTGQPQKQFPDHTHIYIGT